MLFTTCASDLPAFDILSPIHSICYFMHGFLFLWGLFYSFCTNMNDSHLLQYLIYSLMSSARDCSACAILDGGRIGRAASQAGEQGQTGRGSSFLASYSVGFFPLSDVCNSHFGCPVWPGLLCRGCVWSQQGTPHGTGMTAEGHPCRTTARHRAAADIPTADDYDFIF